MTTLAAFRQGAGRRLVLVHGFTQTGRSWHHLAARLAADHEVVLPDLPGHGDSAGVAADLVEGAGLLASVGGSATYVGYSLGGRHVLTLALQHPELVEALVLLGATAGIDDAGERAGRRVSDSHLIADLRARGIDAFLDRWLANPMFSRLPDDPVERSERRRNTVDGLSNSLELAGTGTQQPSWGELPRLEMPVLVLAGEHDTKFVALGRRLAEAIGPNASFDTVAGAGHAAHLERPDRFEALLRRFLADTA